MTKKELILLMVILVMIGFGCAGAGGSSATSTSSGVVEKTGTIDSFGKSTVDVKGGDTLMVYGSDFKSDLDYSLTFDGVLAPEIKVVNSTSLQVTVPKALKQGLVDVELSVGTTSISVVADAIAYDGYFTLAISKITPSQVDTYGGEEVTVYGEGFTEDTQVVINDTQVASKHSFASKTDVNSKSTVLETEVVSSTKLTFKAPAGIEGALTISLTRGEDGTEVKRENIATYVNKTVTISSIEPSEGFTLGGDVITLKGTNFTPTTKVFFNETTSPLVQYVSPTELKVTSPANIEGEATLKVFRQTTNIGDSTTDGDGTATFQYVETPPGYNEAPYLVSARALDSTHVLLQFSEPMSEESAKVEYYDITGTDLELDNELSTDSGSRLVIKEAKLQNETQVVLTTLSMSEINYVLAVTGVTDKAGHAIRANDKFNTYYATGFSGAGEVVAPGHKAIDTDGDGLSDADEQRGFIVEYVLTGGDKRKIAVTSDPEVRDTDGDGLDDYTEFAEATNPRSADTDHDRLSDYLETGTFDSDPLKQDSDGDGINDIGELEQGTSIRLADTDGDQFSDLFELEQGTNPRVANIPEPIILVDKVSAAIDVRYIETTVNGETKETLRTFESTTGSEFYSSVERGVTASLTGKIGYAVETEVDIPPKIKNTLNVGAEATVGGFFTWTDGSSNNFSASNSLSSNFTTDRTQEITRTVEGARVSVAVSFEGNNDVAFTLKDVELSLLMRDPEDPSNLKPIATLLPSTGDLTINIGPISGKRGPILFHAENLIPSEIEQFIKNPSLFVVKIANYNMVDENERNFAYASQDIVERTAGFTIIYNDGVTENQTYRIATAGQFDIATVKPLGVTLEKALESIGLYSVNDEGTSIADLEIISHNHPSADGITVSGEYYVNNTFSITDGIVTRVKGLQISYSNGQPEGYDYWVLLDQYGNQVDATSLATTSLEKKGNYFLIYTKDLDGDGLSEVEERIIGTKDTFCDSDEDGLSDYREYNGQAIPYLTTSKTHLRAQAGNLCTGDEKRTEILDDTETYAWRVAIYERMNGSTPEVRTRYFRAYSNPLKPDTDGDELSDYDEFKLQMTVAQTGEDFPVWRSDALVTDTDDDGLNDYDEINGYTYNSIVDDSLQSVQAEGVRVADSGPFINIKDSDNDRLIDGIERVFGSNPLVSDKDLVQDTNKDGLPDKYAAGETVDAENFKFKTACTGVEYDMSYAQQQKLLGEGKSSVDAGDADGDGLPNVWEYFLCTNPLSDDTDGDTLKDNEEWDYQAKVSNVNNDVSVITPEKYAAAEGACDYALNCTNPVLGGNQINYNTNPKSSDTDNDGLSDLQEVQGWEVWLEEVDNSGIRIAPFKVYPNPRIGDTDGDGLNDLTESQIKTNPLLIDTDSDGKDDSIENAQNKRNPLAKDIIYKLRLTKLTIIENTDNVDNTEVFYDAKNAGAMHFSNIHLTTASGNLVNDDKSILDRNDIYYEMFNTIQPNGAPRTEWSNCAGTFKKAPIYDNELFTFKNVVSDEIQIIYGQEQYLSFSTHFEWNVDNGCEGNGDAPATDRFISFDGTLESSAKIDANDLIQNGFVTLKFTDTDGELRADNTNELPTDHKPVYSVVFTATVEN